MFNQTHNKIIEEKTTGMISERTFELIKEIINSGENFCIAMSDAFDGYVKKLKPVKGVECYKMTAVLENEETADFLFVNFSDVNIEKIKNIFLKETCYIKRGSGETIDLKEIISSILSQNQKTQFIEIYAISPKNSNSSKMLFSAMGLQYLMDEK